jgi:hypothetical protein
MKSTGIFLAAVFGFSFLVSGVMLVTATMKPELFMFGAKHVQADSVQTHMKKDTLTAANASQALPSGQAAVPAGDSTRSSANPQSAQNPSVAGKQETAAPVVPAQSVQAKEEDLQNIVKLYEAMKPEDAAKILGKLQDKEIRTIILHIKKKQAAKILSSFDANRAAQILAQ